MPRHNSKGRSRNPEGQYFLLPYSLVRHPMFRSLSGAALKVFLELRCRYSMRGDGRADNNGELRLPLDEAAKLLGMGKATVKRAFEELEAKGFVVKTEQGQWYGRKATQYRTTDRPYRGARETKDWQSVPVPKK